MVVVYQFLFVLLLVFGAVCPALAGGDNTITIDGKPYTLHRVKAGETLYSIAQSNGVEIAELKKVNRLESSTAAVKTDDIVIIPIYAKAKPAKDSKETVTVKTKEVTKETIKTVTTDVPKGGATHTVKPGEGLYAIARQYGSSAAAIKTANNLTTDAIKAGQTLIIPSGDKKIAEKTVAPVVTNKTTPAPTAKTTTLPVVKTAAPVTTPTNTATPTAKPVSDKVAKANEPVNDDNIDSKLDMKMMGSLKSAFDNEAKGKGTVEAIRGVAALMQESGTENQTKFYALHKTAPVGKVLKVRNTMNNRITYVKVIGKLPDNSDNQNVMVKVSGAAAKYLKVLDAKFQCEVTEYK